MSGCLLAGRSSNGKTADSGSAYRGSNPCVPAKSNSRAEENEPVLSASIRYLMTARIACIVPVLLLPLITSGQQQPAAPPEVEQALRARVTEFLQYHVDGNFRKAY